MINTDQIHQWTTSDRVTEFLKAKFGIENMPCYYWLLRLLKLVKLESLNRCFMKWTETVMPVKRDGLTISSDGKTVRSTGHIGSYENPLYIVSVQISELRMKSARKSMYDKSKDIEDYVQDEASRKSMDRESRIEKSRNRIDTPISQMTWMASQ